MGRKKSNIESMIMSNRIVVFNWTADSRVCPVCKDQENNLREIKNEINSPIINLFNLDYKQYSKKFKKLGNKVVPSINVFVDAEQARFVDRKMNPMKNVGFFKKTEKVMNKKVKSLIGKRSKTDLISVFQNSLRQFIDD